MANSYTVEPNVLPGTAIAKQQAFLRVNHHCISPWMYTSEQIKARNHALFLQEFDRASTAFAYRSVTIPMATSPEMAHYDRQLAAAMELAPDAGEGEV